MTLPQSGEHYSARAGSGPRLPEVYHTSTAWTSFRPPCAASASGTAAVPSPWPWEEREAAEPRHRGAHALRGRRRRGKMADGRAEGEKARRPPPAGGERAAPLAAGPWGALWDRGRPPGVGGAGSAAPGADRLAWAGPRCVVCPALG